MRLRSTVLTAILLLACGAHGGVFAGQGENSPADRAWIGVTLTQGAASGQNGDPRSGGVVVNGVVKESPADRAGLRARDRIVAIDGMAVEGARDLVRRVRQMQVDSWVVLSVVRNGDERELRVRLDNRPSRSRKLSLRDGWIGVEAIDLPPRLSEHFGAPDKSGVMVSNVESGSPAEVAGFELGDVVYSVDGEPVRSARELVQRIARGGLGNVLEFALMRDGVEIELAATVAEELEEK